MSLQRTRDEVRRERDGRAAESRRRQALLEERYGHWTEAAESWKVVAELRPDDAEPRERLAQALARSRPGVR